MEEASVSTQPVYRLDSSLGELTSDGVRVPLQPRAFALLRFLVENVGRIVTREELVDAVWEGVSVSADAVRYAMKELRRGLGDSASAPLFIETVARRGWRFRGAAVRVSTEGWILEGRSVDASIDGRQSSVDREPFVGREGEVGALHDLLSRAQAGRRGMLFVEGEPGIGKSRLVSAFLETANRQSNTICVRAEIAEHVGPGMPYAPLFDVLERIVAGRTGADSIALLRRFAPTWLAQMPALTEPDERAEIEERIQGANQTRMIREWVSVIEHMAVESTIVIAVEDLQWADPSTLDTLFFAARRTEPARILLVATLRPLPPTAIERALPRGIEDLVARGHARSITPTNLSRDSIQAYLEVRFGRDELVAQNDSLCEYLTEASAGNPLFVVSLVDECIEKTVIFQSHSHWDVSAEGALASVPDSLKPLIERQLAGLETDLRAVLEVASVVGMDFSAAELAAGLGKEIDDLEADCDGLVADGRFVQERGTFAWPDGTLSSRYRFSHAMHREVLLGLLSSGRRSRLSRAIAERILSGYAGCEEEVAAELGMYFEYGLDLERAAQFCALAGEESAKRFAQIEAVGHLRHALELMSQSEFEGRDLLEIRARLAFCAPLASVVGYASAELEENLSRLEALTGHLEDSPEMFPAILGLWSLHFVRADFGRTTVSGQRLLRLAERAPSPVLRMQAHQSVGHSLFYQGQVVEAQQHYDVAMDGYEWASHERQDYSVGDDPLVLVLSCRALSDWFLGRSAEAIRSAEESVRQGERLEHPPSLALAWTYGAVLHQLRGDVARASEWSAQSFEITSLEGIALWRELSRIIRGWSIIQADRARHSQGLELIQEGIEGWEATGSQLGLPHFLALQAQSLGRTGEIESGLSVLARAGEMAERTGQLLFRSEIARLTGDLLRSRSRKHRAEFAMGGARQAYQLAASQAEEQNLRANALQAWTSLAELDADPSQANRRLAELTRMYPDDEVVDLDLAKARRHLFGSQ